MRATISAMKRAALANERRFVTGLYTDESPGLKVDPVVVLVLSLVFIFSVVALHSMLRYETSLRLMPWS